MLDVIIARLLDWYSLALLLLIVGSVFSLARLMQQEQRNADKQKWSKTSEGKFSFLVLVISGYYLYAKVLGLSRHNLNPMSLFLLLGDHIFTVILFVCAVVISRHVNFDKRSSP
jgi:hypothetical protein